MHYLNEQGYGMVGVTSQNERAATGKGLKWESLRGDLRPGPAAIPAKVKSGFRKDISIDSHSQKYRLSSLHFDSSPRPLTYAETENNLFARLL
jgi:hypothetical protein